MIRDNWLLSRIQDKIISGLRKFRILNGTNEINLIKIHKVELLQHMFQDVLYRF